MVVLTGDVGLHPWCRPHCREGETVTRTTIQVI